ncbi:alpha-hydroxy-acid oxidizing protein [Verminephrobacter aporrectodeae subsp. tuberculatae]|uniref:alpha-hydroxy acid oxidase n=1 Tax=Verminephrobacter aporrectodeae TaxID=1110389 RepID=UPI0022390692|nr:alpha-hydroxy acid oxidase [Verminephrobacter aporrectodeae]MCW5221263.1 alpha-hydroxy-acid oxidizing protein [Verminephrobacter aporrectodeae subsp. tuberculatae]MCW5290554.1 alpha-hydroxy-acid oxidizing protein [Verminephrobacter aporrectodeae subsp. tuberculatae]
MSTPPPPISLPPEIVSLADHESHARTRLDSNAWAYFSGGAADEITLAANRSAWAQIPLLPRVLRPLAGGHTRVELLGRTLAHPILLAPVAYQCMAHPDGELGSACAAAALGAGMVLSTQASTRLERVADAIRDDAGRGPLWFQLYWQHDRGFTRELVQRAEQAGYEALVLTVDAPCHGARDRERRAGFRLPAGVAAVNLLGLPPPPRVPLRADQSSLFDGLLQHAPTWADVQWLQTNTRLPVLLKGLLHPDDARQAVALGVAGLIVSNHGGRTLDGSPSTASALPCVADAVAGALPLLVDGGIRRGTDVLKALALGACAVLIGRPALYGLANAGAAGVAHVLRLLRDELEIAMALTGCATLAQAPQALASRPPRPDQQ